MRPTRKSAQVEAIERRLLLSVARPAYNTGAGFFVKDGLVYDANGNEFVMKGPNMNHAWGSYNSNYAAIDQIAKMGANATRVVMYRDVVADAANNWTDSADTVARRKAVVERYLANGMVAVVEDHASIQDSSSQSSVAALNEITTHWIENASWLKQYEQGVILNIANEWGPVVGASGSNTVWRDAYVNNVLRLRKGADNTLGTADDITNLICIDAAGWGQDFNSLALHAQAIQDADPQHNVLFSIHLYGQWRDEDRSFEVNGAANSDYGPWDIKSRLQSLTNRANRLPLVIGEWAWEDFRDFSNSSAPYAGYRTARVMEIAHELGIGWTGWSYNGSSPSTLNMVSGNISNANYNTSTDLSEWGDTLTNNPVYGLKASAKRASVFPIAGLPAAPSGLPAMPTTPPAENKIVLERTLLNVPENGAAAINVRLSHQPTTDVTVIVSRLSGDADLSVRSSSTTLTFTPENWGTLQWIALDADDDADAAVGTAKIQLSAANFQTVDFVAKEIDADLATGTQALTPVADRRYNTGGTSTTASVNATTAPQPTGAFFMRFNLAELGGKIGSALLRVYKSTATTNLTVRVFHALTDTWTEAATSGINTSYPVATAVVSNAAGYMTFDVTDIVRREHFKDGVITLAIATAGGSITVNTRENAANKPELLVTTSEAIRPSVVGSSFDYSHSPNKLVLTFDEDVSASLSAQSVTVVPVGGGPALVLSSPTYDFSSNTARFTFASAVPPDGQYQAYVDTQSVTDAAGNSVLLDHRLDFFSLAGDINHDAAVNFDDLLTLARNYGDPGSFSQGDVNYSGRIDFDDLLVLAQRYGTTLAIASPLRVANAARKRSHLPEM
jgi:mannan endo-1,4-beta-mannosidase